MTLVMGALDDRGGRSSADGRGESPAKRADRNWGEIVQELRVTQTGTQILAGFLLTVAFQPTFGRLDAFQHVVYLVLVVVAAATTTVGLIPVSLHRRLFRHHEKTRLVTLADRLLKVALVLVSVLTAGIVFFLFDVVVGLAAALPAGVIAAVAMLVVLVIYPARVARSLGAP